MTIRNSGRITRRRFLTTTGAGVAAATIVPSSAFGAADKLNIGSVGVGGMQGASDVGNVSRGTNIYALCDVDSNQMKKSAGKFPNAKKYTDFRQMLDKEHKNLNAISVTIPDHMHATVALWAMERGLGVYCQKPLTQTVWEARLLTKAAKKYKVATQMGNQGYSCEATRVACELLWDDRIGEVKEVHCMSGGGFARKVKAWPKPTDPPAHVDWNLWLGRVPDMPYYPKIHPVQWRGYQLFGTQMIGDWGIHMLGPANWGLQLGSPTSVECISVDGVNPVTYPSYSCKFEFPERPNQYVKSGKMPAFTLYWYEGSAARNFKLPEEISPKAWRGHNCLFIGSKGYMGTRGRGEGVRLLPEEAMKDFKKPPKVIDRVKGGHHGSWLQAVRDGKQTCSNFTVAGPYAEWLLLGTICWRFPNQKLLWDGPNLRFTNNDKANEFIKPKFRKGWELKDITL